MKNNFFYPLNSLYRLLTLSLFIAFFVSCKNDSDDLLTVWPDTILLNEASLYPEGIVYSESLKKLIVGSYYKGKIVTVDAEGNIANFISDPTLVSVVGMSIDESKNWLVVCNSDGGISLNSNATTSGRLAQVIVYDLTTGAKLRTTDLSGLYQGGHFANDIRTDNNGTCYITDSFSPIVYKISASGTASILANNTSFIPPQGAFGLNGLVFHPNNYIIVGMAYNGKLYKIPLDNPQNITEITLNTPVNSIDGLLLVDNNTIVLVSNNFTGAPFNEAVYKLTTTNNWTSATVTSTFTNLVGTYPTTVTKINTDVYVNFAYFQNLASGVNPITTFKIQKVNF